MVLRDHSGHTTLDVASLKAGIYLLRLIAGEEQAIFKFVKQ